MAAISDDEVIKKRLLIDGDGGNDDKRLNNLIKTFIRWCNSSESSEDNHLTCQRMLATLAQCDLTIDKSAQIYRMNQLEQTNYQILNKQIEQKIKEAQEKISECKNELQQAKRIRKHRQEYDSLAKVIQQHPDRQGTTQKLELLDEELSSLEDKKQTLEQKLDIRRKQFHVLISSIHELQRILEDDEANERTDNSVAEMDTT